MQMRERGNVRWQRCGSRLALISVALALRMNEPLELNAIRTARRKELTSSRTLAMGITHAFKWSHYRTFYVKNFTFVRRPDETSKSPYGCKRFVHNEIDTHKSTRVPIWKQERPGESADFSLLFVRALNVEQNYAKIEMLRVAFNWQRWNCADGTARFWSLVLSGWWHREDWRLLRAAALVKVTVIGNKSRCAHLAGNCTIRRSHSENGTCVYQICVRTRTRRMLQIWNSPHITLRTSKRRRKVTSAMGEFHFAVFRGQSEWKSEKRRCRLG